MPRFEATKSGNIEQWPNPLRLSTSRSNVDAPAIQDKYWNYLARKSPKLWVEFGRLKTTVRIYPSHGVHDDFGDAPLVKVKKIEEKGSDVSLGAHLVLDASRRLADVFVLMSCDSDFEPALKVVREHFGSKFGLLIPNARLPKLYARLHPEFVRHLDAGDILTAILRL
jgi:uncharacterized LabA/DUF88 family protein